MTRKHDHNSVDKCIHLASYQRNVLLANWFASEMSSYPLQHVVHMTTKANYQRQRQVWFIPLADERGVCR